MHGGIYNREMASSLAAGACLVIAGFFVAGRLRLTAVHYGTALFFFILLFAAFRKFVFRDAVLHTRIDRGEGSVKFSLDGAGRKSFTFPLEDLQTVRQDYVSIAPENPDGIKVVEKIALQHGTVIPGFGKNVEFHTVELEFKGGKRVAILASGEPMSADNIVKEIHYFIER